MMSIMTMMMCFSCLMTLWTLNPMKMCMILLMVSALTFTMMYKLNGSPWFPIIFFMLLMGGILIMFMIISSVLPNEKSLKSKKIPITMLTMALMMSTNSFNEASSWNNQLKMILNYSTNITLILMMILGYFLSFTMLISKEKNPLRSI